LRGRARKGEKMKLKYDASKPIYEQIIDKIKKMIVRGELKPGDKLPSQREMAKKVEVNPNTIQRAYREMENFDLVETKRGLGTFIIDDEKIVKEISEEMANRTVDKFISEMKSLSFNEKGILQAVKKNLEKI